MRNFRLAFTAALLLGGAATPLLAQGDAARCGRGGQAALRRFRDRPLGDGPVGEAGRQLLALRQRQLGQEHRDRRRPHQRRRRRASGRRGRAPGARDRRGSGPRSGQVRARSASRSATSTPAGWTRPAIEARGHRAAQALSRPDRRDLEPHRPASALSPQPGYHEPGRSRHPARSGRSDPLHRRRRPGRARPSQPRLLPARGREIRRDPRRLPRLCREDAAARRNRRRRGQGRPDHRARDRARQGPLGAGAPARHQADLQSDEPRPARRAGAAVRVAGLPRGGGARQRRRP